MGAEPTTKRTSATRKQALRKAVTVVGFTDARTKVFLSVDQIHFMLPAGIWEVTDLESVKGRWGTITCRDVKGTTKTFRDHRIIGGQKAHLLLHEDPKRTTVSICDTIAVAGEPWLVVDVRPGWGTVLFEHVKSGEHVEVPLDEVDGGGVTEAAREFGSDWSE